MTSNYEHMSRDYLLRGTHLVSYKEAFTMLFNLISHLYHDKRTLRKYFKMKDKSFYKRINPLIFSE